MGGKVTLSQGSQELIREFFRLCNLDLKQFSSPMELHQLISWLQQDPIIPATNPHKTSQEIEFILASLRAELLHDVLIFIPGDNLSPNPGQDDNSGTAKLKLVLLALAGTLLAGCEGFDSITTMLSVLSLPSLIILFAGLGFSILSMVVFYSYNLVQVSKNLGVTLVDAPKLLDVYLLQMSEIKSLRKKIDTYKLAELPTDKLLQLEHLLIMLQKRFRALVVASSQFEKSLNSPKMQLTKAVVSSLAGLLFFGSGFFAGQSVAMFIASLFLPVVLPTFWPVILFSVIVGIAAFSLFWYVEHVGLKKLVSGWFGLDEDKIDQICDARELDKEEKKLENLKEKVVSTARLTSRVTSLQQQLERTIVGESVPLRVSANIHAFHSQPVIPNASQHINDGGAPTYVCAVPFGSAPNVLGL